MTVSFVEEAILWFIYSGRFPNRVRRLDPNLLELNIDAFFVNLTLGSIQRCIFVVSAVYPLSISSFFQRDSFPVGRLKLASTGEVGLSKRVFSFLPMSCMVGPGLASPESFFTFFFLAWYKNDGHKGVHSRRSNIGEIIWLLLPLPQPKWINQYMTVGSLFIPTWCCSRLLMRPVAFLER